MRPRHGPDYAWANSRRLQAALAPMPGKVGRIPDGGGWRVHDRDSEQAEAAEPTASIRSIGS